MARVTQLRMYTIQEGKMDQWLEGWRTGVAPLREKMGFQIQDAWVIEAENTFVWILTYGGDDWEAKDAAYYVSDERKALNPNPAQYIVQAREWFLTPVAR